MDKEWQILDKNRKLGKYLDFIHDAKREDLKHLRSTLTIIFALLATVLSALLLLTNSEFTQITLNTILALLVLLIILAFFGIIIIKVLDGMWIGYQEFINYYGEYLLFPDKYEVGYKNEKTKSRLVRYILDKDTLTWINFEKKSEEKKDG